MAPSMGSDDSSIDALVEALRVSPDNLPLRRHLADLLVRSGRLREAEQQYREALALEPASEDLKLLLADVFLRGEKLREALVLVESLVESPQTSGRAYRMHARLLLARGDPEAAARQYRRAIDQDPDVADPGLAARLGVFADEDEETAAASEVEDGRVRGAGDAGDASPRGPVEEVETEVSSVTFADVGGMDGIKDDIRMKIILPLERPELYAAYGKKVGGGILMYGPPGCGKTHLARATAGEAKARFISVGIHDVLDMWIGESERKLHEIFEQARRHRPCVLFFDEVDALGASRSDLRVSAARQTVNQFLSELDGVASSNDGLLVLAATNAPWHLDSAFRRPGRFDRVIFVPPPDGPARVGILRVLLQDKPQESVDLEKIARRSDGYSGADLQAIVEAAVEQKLRDAVRSGRPSPIRTRDLQTALKGMRPTVKEWFATARNHALYGNVGGIYDDVLAYMKLL